MKTMKINKTLCSKCDHLFFVRLHVRWTNGDKGKVSGSCMLMPNYFEKVKKINGMLLDVNGLPIILKCGKFRMLKDKG